MSEASNTFDVLVVGELNVDLILNELAAFPSIGKEVLSCSMSLTLGSSAAILAHNLSQLGSKVAFAGKMGNDVFGDIILQRLQAGGVDTSLIIRGDHLTTGATVVLNVDNDRAMITHPGAMETLSLEDIPIHSLTRSRHLHFSSYFLQPGLKKDIATLFREAKRLGMTTSFDPQWDPGEKWDLDIGKILPHVDIFLPNENELIFITGQRDLAAAIDHISSFPCMTAIKRGVEGSTLLHKGTVETQPAFLNDRFADAIGAGDSFNAGFIHQFLLGNPPDACQRFANFAGSISTTAPGGTGAFDGSIDIHSLAREKYGYAKDQSKR